MFVRAVNPQFRDAIPPRADDERARQRVQLKPVAQLLAGVGLYDPDVVFVPLRRDPVRGGAKLTKEIAD